MIIASEAVDAASLPGLLWGMRFDDGGNGRLLEPNEEIALPGSFGEGFLWLHFDLVAAQFGTLIEAGRLGPKRLAASVFGADNHQRVTVEADYIGGVVADLTRSAPEATAEDAAGRLHFVMGTRSLVSGRRRHVESPDAAREAATEGVCITSPILLLETLMGYVIASIAASGTKLTDDLDAIEDHVLDDRVRDDRRRLGPIRRDAVRLHRQLLGLRAVFHRLEEDGIERGLPAAAVATAARLAQRLDALDRDMNLAAERSRLLQDELAARLGEEANRQLYTLSILTALFLPPTLVTGLFGINTKGLPFGEIENGSNIVIVVAIVSAIAAYAVIRILGIRAPRA